MMKTLYMIGGTMGDGKTTVCQQLKKDVAVIANEIKLL